MRSGQPLATGAFYPERTDLPEPAADRLLGGLGFHLRNVLARSLGDQDAREAEVCRHTKRFLGTPLASRITELRYSLRRDGFGPEAAAECYGWYCAALAAHGARLPPPHVLGAADRLLAGGMLELPDPAERLQALGLAAAAFAAHGAPVHIITSSDAGAARVAQALEPVFSLLGLGIGSVAEGTPAAARREAYALPVVCAAHRQIASDYLQDHLKAGSSLRRLSSRIGSLAGEVPIKDGLLLRGLNCALVADADWVMLDDATSPVVISAEADRSRERLLYEQALEFAHTLHEDAEFTLGDRGPALTPAGGQRLDRLLAPLGGVWAIRERRRQLIETALVALHLSTRDRDYRVENQRVIFPQQDTAEGKGDGPASQDLHGMIELKEGCRLSAQRNVLARLPPARLFRRYLHLAGVCADARGLEREFWTTYSLHTTLAGGRGPRAPIPARMFLSVEAKRRALLECARSAAARGEALVIAVRSPREAQALAALLQESGVSFKPLQEPEQLEQPGSVALAMHPAENRFLFPPRKTPLRLLIAELQDSPRHLYRMREAFAASSCELLLSLEDESIVQLVGAATLGVLSLGAVAELPAARARWLVGLALRRAEKARRLARDEAASREQYLSDLLAFSGSRD